MLRQELEPGNFLQRHDVFNAAGHFVRALLLHLQHRDQEFFHHGMAGKNPVRVITVSYTHLSIVINPAACKALTLTFFFVFNSPNLLLVKPKNFQQMGRSANLTISVYNQPHNIR